MMSYGIPSDEVAEDYKKALEDLTMNSRYEISNLTVIAKENTEHALAISEALKNHIKKTSPQKKLPAFYVLDSVVKNVGTPYTLFFGRQLYSTFMEAYALVDNNVRRKMDEMLKTWKEPVPGSIDTRPVFPPDVTRPIENALIKARTSAVQARQEHVRSQQQSMGRGHVVPSPVPYRETPTPPNVYRQQQQTPTHMTPGYPPNYPPPQQQYPVPVSTQQYPNQPPNGYQPYGQQYGQPLSQTPQTHGLPPRPPSQQYAQPPSNASSWQQLQNQGYHVVETSIEKLNSDISNLITASKADFAQNPWDSSIQTRLKALLDLQTVIQSQELPPDQIALIRDQVTQLSQASQPIAKPPAPLAHIPTTPVTIPPVATPQPSLSSLLGPGALAALLARQSATPQPTPPAIPAVPIRSPQPSQAHPYQPPPAVSSTTPVQDPGSLLERLRAAGILGGTIPTNSPAPTAVPAINIPPGFPPPLFTNTPPTNSRTPLAELPNDVVLKPASLKIPRPHLISSLYEKLGTPCNQCGRRFQSDQEGKDKKRAHLDWHFKVNQRMSDAEKRGQHRSWYVDELEWIRSREVEGENETSSNSVNGSASSAVAAAKNPKLQYLPVPDDPTLANSVCPICQEKFEMKWLDEAQEFVWMDAKKIGDRIYHASCHAEATKDVEVAAQQHIKRGTPEPVGILGKRKAEDEQVSLRTKIKTEPIS